MTDKLIERIKLDDIRGHTTAWSPTLPQLRDRILADAKIIKAAEELAQSLSGDIVHMPYVHEKAAAYRAAVSEQDE